MNCLRSLNTVGDIFGTQFNFRDAAQEYSKVPFDMEPEILPEDSPVPINKTGT